METPFVFGKIATDQNFTDRRVETERLLQNFSKSDKYDYYFSSSLGKIIASNDAAKTTPSV